MSLKPQCEKTIRALYTLPPEAAIARVERLGDLFRPILSTKQSLPKSLASSIKGKKQSNTRVDPSKRRAPHRSTQGSRRRFSIVRHSKAFFEISLEGESILKRWHVEAPLPAPQGDHEATFLGEFPLAETHFTKTQLSSGSKDVWDAGTYEPLEGDLRSGEIQFYLQGEKTMGQWTLTELNREERWNLKTSSPPQEAGTKGKRAPKKILR